jgi:hypothetical protein
MEQIVIRKAGLGDLSEVAEMCHCLWLTPMLLNTSRTLRLCWAANASEHFLGLFSWLRTRKAGL